MRKSSEYLRDRLGEVPVILFPVMEGRVENLPAIQQSLKWGSAVPAIWSFMLAARSRGLGTSWTSLHLTREKEMAEIIELPFDELTQIALIPLAYTVGTDFKSPPRRNIDDAIHWNGWSPKEI